MNWVLGADVLLLHWDGATWTQHANPVVFSGAGGQVSDILANSPSDVHFVGHGAVVPSNSAVLFRWTGSGFAAATCAAPGSPICTTAVACSGTSASDVWAVGGSCFGGNPAPSTFRYVCRWNGTAWTLMSPPTSGYTGWAYREVHCVSANDVWVCGEATVIVNFVETHHPLIQRFTGGGWSTVPAPVVGGVAAPVYALQSTPAGEVFGGIDGGVATFVGAAWALDLTFPPIAPGPFGSYRITEISRQGNDLYAVADFTGNGPVIVRRATVPIGASTLTRSFCSGTPSASLVALSIPVVGGAAFIGIDDPANVSGFAPLVTQSYWIVSPAAGGAFPCGVLAPGLGVAGAPGEILLDLGVPTLAFGPTAWAGPGQLSTHLVAIPNLAWLAGVQVFTQGVLVDVGATPPAGLLTNALDIVIGS